MTLLNSKPSDDSYLAQSRGRVFMMSVRDLHRPPGPVVSLGSPLMLLPPLPLCSTILASLLALKPAKHASSSEPFFLSF